LIDNDHEQEDLDEGHGAKQLPVDSLLREGDEESSGPGIGYWISSIVFEILFGVPASIVVSCFSRKRECRADAGAAALMGDRRPMIDALRALGNRVVGGEASRTSSAAANE